NERMTFEAPLPSSFEKALKSKCLDIQKRS
ncbi:hypothetical protein AAHR35_13125, partial [Listeria monocytogenes]